MENHGITQIFKQNQGRIRCRQERNCYISTEYNAVWSLRNWSKPHQKERPLFFKMCKTKSKNYITMVVTRMRETSIW